MALDVEVSVIIPTYNRRELVQRAIGTVLAQTRAVQEILVVDDGSTDGTGDALAAAFGDRIRYVRQANGGVSSARNHGLRLARGRYLALLDSDDEWLPEKTQRQIEWLQARPDYGMALCDVVRMDAEHRDVELFRRRELLPEDGMILKWVLVQPALVPASVMMRREVFETVGGFDETLATGEDLDFHLRVAARWPIGIVEQPLVRAMRGHDGLSSLARTYDDYVRVIERAVALAAGSVSEVDRHRALARAYARNARGMVYLRRWQAAWELARKAWRLEPEAAARRELLGLMPLAARRVVAGLRHGR
ncbi:glycosyltransferase family 2 protein [Rhizobacter sp. AJA081-3]|uniref:glycosyltransferase family 2 protein n=1 Tax=Rhizobacter sp. AJA081-3 TaxID=2753607 RepID=UPI001AE09F6F|nr:glycosyltransferase family A protein [Rhizobacter sp. AJA081-3]QTN24587.1 glycosyltransferase family 2 protein [Rhizobacter sp. AJA081-3]